MASRLGSIKTKFIIVIFITVFIFLGGLLVLSYNTLKEGALQNAHDLSAAVLSGTDRQIDAFFMDLKRLALSMSGYPAFYEVRPGDMKPVILSAVKGRSDYLRAIYLGTVDGRMYEWGIGEGFVDNAPVLGPDYDPRERPWFREALEMGGFSISEPYMYASVKAMGITAVTPVYDLRDRFVGVLGLDIMLDDLGRMIGQLESDGMGRIILLNRNDEVIVNQFGGGMVRAMEKFALFPVKDLDLYKSGEIVTLSGQDERYYVTCTRNGMTGWKLILAIPYDAMMSNAVKGIKFVIFLDILLMTMLMTALSYFGNTMIMHPIDDMVAVIRRLKAGEAGARIHMGRDDEFGMLAREFNHLIETVNGYSRGLEEKVRERTEKLEDLQKENVRLRVIEEKERIYGYLHDSLGARLTNIFISNSVAQSAADNDPAVLHDMLDRIQNNTEQGIADLKEILLGSKDGDRRIIDFGRLVKSSIEKRLELKNISFSFSSSTLSELNALDRDIRFELDKILQELVSNILKHSGASRAELVLEVRHGKIVLVMSDDGCGGAASGMERGGFGLRNIKNRVALLGGAFLLSSPEGKGTKIKIHIPVQGNGGR